MAIHWQNAASSHLKKLIETPSFGLITDVDGTVSPIVDNPSESQISPHSRNLLSALTQRLPLVAAVSGRDALTLYQLLGVPGMVYVGNHGLERWEEGKIKRHPDVAAYRVALQTAKESIEREKLAGVWVEDKLATLSIHYRQSPDPQAMAPVLEGRVDELAGEHGLLCFAGRMVFELRPPLDINKGTAFSTLVHAHELEAALYLGDDITDTDAFTAARQLRAKNQCSSWAVAVDSSETPSTVIEAADFFADGISDVEDLLAWVLSERKASST